MLREHTLFGIVDKPELSIARLREFEKQSLSMHEDGYYVAFSGGKDSIVILDLVRRAGVRYTTHFALTTVDPPELLDFVRTEYPDVEMIRPQRSMWQLIRRKMMPPTRTIRYCCRLLKEVHGKGRMIVTGIRWAESVRRSHRRMMEQCVSHKATTYLHPIIEWSNADVWQYIRDRKMPYCSLYDEGFTRIGCIGCPMTGQRRLQHFERWPNFAKAYRLAFDAAAKKRLELGSQYAGNLKWETGDDMWNWWMNENRSVSDTDDDQLMLFE